MDLYHSLSLGDLAEDQAEKLEQSPTMILGTAETLSPALALLDYLSQDWPPGGSMGKHYTTLPPDLAKLQEDILDAKRRLMMMIDSAALVRGVDVKKIETLRTGVDQGVEEIIFTVKDPYK